MKKRIVWLAVSCLVVVGAVLTSCAAEDIVEEEEVAEEGEEEEVGGEWEEPGDMSPSWSPDGNKTVFYSGRDGNGEIYVMNADGTN